MNINEIAKLAGVSRATVSRYLNNGYVSNEKREIISKVIEETGYQPSFQAKQLRSRKTKLIGVIIPKINSDTVSRMVAGISDVLSAHDYQILLANTNNDIQEELKYLALFRENQVDGVLYIATIFTGKHKKILKEYKVPVVILGQRLDGYSCVYQDDYKASRDLADLLLKHAKTPAFIGVTQKDESAGLNRRVGYEDSLKSHGMQPDTALMSEDAFTVDAGKQQMERLMKRNPNIDAVFCVTDNIAAGAMSYLKAAGKRIPDDVQVVGIGDTPIAKLLSPTLTSVHYYYKSSGIEAAGVLIEQIEAEDMTVRELKMGYRIMKRETTITDEEKNL